MVDNERRLALCLVCVMLMGCCLDVVCRCLDALGVVLGSPFISLKGRAWVTAVYTKIWTEDAREH